MFTFDVYFQVSEISPEVDVTAYKLANIGLARYFTAVCHVPEGVTMSGVTLITGVT